MQMLKSSFFEKIKFTSFGHLCGMFCSMMHYDGSFLGFKFGPKLRFLDKCRLSLFGL